MTACDALIDQFEVNGFAVVSDVLLAGTRVTCYSRVTPIGRWSNRMNTLRHG
jgi:hypothetical protein